MLRRKAQRALRQAEGDAPAAEAWIEAVIARMCRAGYLDDERVANAKASAMRRAGKSTRAVRAALQTRGVSAELVDGITSEAATADAQAIWTFARKKKLGPYRSPELRADFRQKDLATLARAGYAYSLAQRVVDAKEPEPPDS